MPRCHTGALTLSVKQYPGGGGTEFFLVILRNHSSRACSLEGYPGVSLLNARRHQVGRSASRQKGRSPHFTVSPRHAGSAKLTLFNSNRCAHPKAGRYLRVIPPDERRALLKRRRFVGCGPAIYPLQPGTRPPSEHR